MFDIEKEPRADKHRISNELEDSTDINLYIEEPECQIQLVKSGGELVTFFFQREARARAFYEALKYAHAVDIQGGH